MVSGKAFTTCCRAEQELRPLADAVEESLHTCVCLVLPPQRGSAHVVCQSGVAALVVTSG
eukprot:COSAG01_NODE_4391_length_5072_cov_2.913533_4_plen_60_part_00